MNEIWLICSCAKIKQEPADSIQQVKNLTCHKLLQRGVANYELASISGYHFSTVLNEVLA